MMRPFITILNGSLGGRAGNTAKALELLETSIGSDAEVGTLVLADSPEGNTAQLKQIDNSQGFVFATGTYWDSWGSPLQKFLEQMTEHEGTELWLGKPAAVIVTMHSVGGKAVLSRLQGVLSTMGLLIPPMSGMVYSAVAHASMDSAPSDSAIDLEADFWQLDDLAVVAHNLLQALQHPAKYQAWPVDRKDPKRLWLKT